MAAPKARQVELDAFARRRGWSSGPFRSWGFHGFTIAVANQGEKYVAARGSERKFFGDLGELERYVAYLAVTGREPG
jgi:hypothetical protein